MRSDPVLLSPSRRGERHAQGKYAEDSPISQGFLGVKNLFSLSHGEKTKGMGICKPWLAGIHPIKKRERENQPQ